MAVMCPRGTECPDPEACQTGAPCSVVRASTHRLTLAFGPACASVVAVCSCGWRGKPANPEAHDGKLSVWVEPWQKHAGVYVAPQRRLMRRSGRQWSKV